MSNQARRRTAKYAAKQEKRQPGFVLHSGANASVRVTASAVTATNRPKAGLMTWFAKALGLGSRLHVA